MQAPPLSGEGNLRLREPVLRFTWAGDATAEGSASTWLNGSLPRWKTGRYQLDMPDTLKPPAGPKDRSTKKSNVRQRRDGAEFLVARLAVPGILAAVVLQPNLLLLSSMDRLILFGALLFASVVMVSAYETCSTKTRFLLRVFIAIIIGGITYGIVTVPAMVDEAINDKRCLSIQRDMLSAHRRIEDGPDVFRALGCRPQGSGIIRVKPTDRELRAGRALTDGGYPAR